MKKFINGFICALMILTIVGCKKELKLKTGDNILASFKDEKLNITVDDLYSKLKEQYGLSYLVELVDHKILDKLYETDDIANKYVENQLETYTSYYGTEDKLLEALKQYGYDTINEFKENVLLDYKRNLALKKYVKNNISDKEIEKYYNNEIFGDITASHILITVDTDSSMTDDEKAEKDKAALTTIDEILKKLKDGKDFHELAKEYSKDTANASNGGRLDAFNKGEMESQFEEAAIKLENGKYTTTAVKTQYGYHLIYKESQKDKPSLKDVKQTIIDNLIEDKINEDSKLLNKALIELRKEYGFIINDDDLNTYYDNAVNEWLYGKDEN